MTAHDRASDQAAGLLGWLGLVPRHPAAARSASAQIPDGRHLSQYGPLAEINAFIARHELEVNPRTLSVAWSYVTADDAELVRQIDRRVRDHSPVTAAWLDEISGKDGHDEAARLASLMARLETSIAEFGKVSQDARRATSDYNSALEAHVEELEQVNRAGAVISELAAIAKVMLKRTRDIEQQMQRSVAQTRVLRRRLDAERRNAALDHLTGLPNRRAFEAHYEAEHRRACSASEPLSLAFCDIDHFKQVNDRHGHEAGDRVIKLVAENLARISNDRCHVARHGGEEFVILFRGISVPQAFAKLEALREQLAQRRLINRATDVPLGQITFSAGLADVFAYPDRRAALKAADTALYRAKQEGRNRIVMAAPGDSVTAA
ncbi:MAG: GGDEF domain-containing protein [Proteobacteria bacterium]|nr:GGDEF domain-containing protein [Pseudomonadota bacterium]